MDSVNRDDFFEILEYTQSLHIPYRVNTNCWWAKEKNFYICDTFFAEAIDLIKFFQAKKMYMFAFSFDVRYNNNFALAGDLIEAIKLCEKVGVYYQIIFTGMDNKSIFNFIQYLVSVWGGSLRFIIPVQMQMVDIGRAVNLKNETFSWQSNRSECKRKGFYRPTILHVDPYGNVRTCLYAIGLCNVGNLALTSFADILNNFPKTFENAIFSTDEKYNEVYNTLLKPYLYLYKPIIHECTKNIILSKTINKIHENLNLDLIEMHKSIAKEMNLST